MLEAESCCSSRALVLYCCSGIVASAVDRSDEVVRASQQLRQRQVHSEARPTRSATPASESNRW